MSDQEKSDAARPDSPNMVLMEVTGKSEAPSLGVAAEQLGVDPADIDAQYGVVALDPKNGLYVVRVRGDRVSAKSSGPYRGPFSDPQISGFGLPRKTESR
jgi:hypothetical protein